MKTIYQGLNVTELYLTNRDEFYLVITNSSIYFRKSYMKNELEYYRITKDREIIDIFKRIGILLKDNDNNKDKREHVR